MFGRQNRRLRVRRTRRSLLVRLVPMLAVTTLVAALLAVVTVTSLRSQDTSGTPAEVEKSQFEITPAAERPAYTPEDAALVATVDPSVPTIQNGTVVAELAPHDLPSFELLGVTWTGGVPVDVAEVQVRWQQDGTWSEWTILDPEDEPAEGGIPGTEPKWIGPSQGAQARIVASRDIDPAGLTLVTVSPGSAPTLTQAANAQPSITSRAAWGARPYGGSGCGSAPENGTFQGTIVHHTAGSNVYGPEQSGGIVRSIQAYHMDGQKWCDIGYNFLIDRYGQIFEGRAGGITNTPYGAHAGNTQVNANTTGISLMGEFTSAVPPLAMTNALVQLATWRHSLFGVPAKGAYSIGGVTIQRIDGHRSVKSTACPGNQVFGWLNAPGGMSDQVQAALAANASFVKSANDPSIYLLVDGTKHHVPDGAEMAILATRFGSYVSTVDASALSRYPTGSPATRYVRDQASQALYLLHADGTKHRFPTVDLVAKYGYELGSYLPLSAAQVGQFGTGGEVGPVFAVETGTQLNLISGSTSRPITSVEAWIAVRGGSDSVGRMSAANAAKYTPGPAVVQPGVLVKEQSDPAVYLSANDSELAHVSSFDIAKDAGVTRLVTVGDGLLDRNPTSKGSLGPAVTCGSKSYLVGSGRLTQVTGWGSSGLTPVTISAQACDALVPAGGTLSPPFFVQRSGAAVYLVEGGQLHHVRSWARLLQLAGGSAPTILGWGEATSALVPVGAPELVAGTYVQFAGSAEVYRGDGRTIQHVTSYAALLKANGGTVPPIEQLPAAQKAYYTAGTPLT
ncbi:N-acetylmuramoyl-L-alanine amidase [Aeromicrobium sp. Leaf350]|uniref:N-acetylmuramoyl-L-alanine amidase n=1 Tax=Aeromicrobium sp. Leaf350 TaxID=2876565 RepID=UPI001E554377|nr:N-acetylmuramoyl-L-alanine amidase [Aeromicrobium sp. Leaf350]